MSEYLQKTESYTTSVYETYQSIPVDLSYYYVSDDHEWVTKARKEKGYHQSIYDGVDMRDMIIYSINYKGERIGTEDDVSILLDYIEEGYVVAVVDFKCQEIAAVPDLEFALADIVETHAKEEHNKYSSKAGTTVNGYYCYTLPSGYRLARDIWYWNSYYYSSLGTRDELILVECWNLDASDGLVASGEFSYTEDFTLKYKTKDGTEVEKSYTAGNALANADNIYECVNSDGSNLNYDCFLDIIYPSMPIKETPVMVRSATSDYRFKNVCGYTGCTDVGFLFSGYTFTTYDYAYKPTARFCDSYGFNDNFQEEFENSVKYAQAAIRCIRYYSKDYGYGTDNYCCSGASKGASGANVLAIIENELLNEEASDIMDTEKTAIATYDVTAAFEGDIIVGGEYLNIQQPFLYYDVPYGPILDEDGLLQHDVYGNVITHDYYGVDGTEYVRAATTADLRASTQEGVEDIKFECDEGFRTVTGTSIKADYRTNIEDRAATQDFIYYNLDGSANTEKTSFNLTYGTEDSSKYSTKMNTQDSFYYYIDTDTKVGYVAIGNGVWRYLDPDMDGFRRVPIVMSCGTVDNCNAWSGWYDALDRMEVYAINPYLPMTMECQDHVRPTGYDYNDGYRRHDVYMNFFNHYLKTDEYNYAELVFASPADETSRIILPSTTIELKFYDKMNVETVIAAASVKDAAGNAVAGEWTADEIDTHFVFTPDEVLDYGATYTISIDKTDVKDANGNGLNKDHSSTFTVTSYNTISTPVDDCFVTSASKTQTPHTDKLLYNSLQITNARTSYVTFDKADLIGKTHLVFEASHMTDMVNGSSFNLAYIDGASVTSKTSYNTRPTGDESMGTVTTDAYGMAAVSLAGLESVIESSEQGDVITFVMSYDKTSGDTVMFQSLESNTGTHGVKAVAVADAVKPVKVAYTSQNNPDENYLNSNTLYVGAYEEDIRYTFLTFDAAALNNKKSLSLYLPIANGTPSVFYIYVLEGDKVDDSLTYNTMPEFGEEQLTGTAVAGDDGGVDITLAPRTYAEGKVTLVVAGDVTTYRTDNQKVSLDFESSSKLRYWSTLDGNSYSDYALRVGGSVSMNSYGYYAADTGGETDRMEDPDNSANHVWGIYYRNANTSKIKIYNVWGKGRNLDSTDINKIYRFTFKAKGTTGQVVCGVGKMSGAILTGYEQKTVLDETSTEFVTVTYDLLITEELAAIQDLVLHIGSEGGYQVGDLYIDDVTSEIYDSSASVTKERIALYTNATEHTCVATQVQSEDYLKTAGNCGNKAVYYESCSICGEALSTVFEGDEVTGEHASNDTPEADGTTICSICGTILSYPEGTYVAYSEDKSTWAYTDTIANALEKITSDTGYVEIYGGDITLTETITIPESTSVTLSSRDGSAIIRGSSFKDASIFTLSETSSLNLENITVDGDEVLVTVSGSVASIISGTSVTVGDGAVIKDAHLVATNDYHGGAFYVNPGGTLTMTGGEIRNCWAHSGGGVYLHGEKAELAENMLGATFNMTGGLITGCKSGMQAGTSSSATSGGAAVCIMYHADMNMSGGVITGNYGGRSTTISNMEEGCSNDGAVLFKEVAGSSTTYQGQLYLSGNAVIYGNYAWAYGTETANTEITPSDIAAVNKGFTLNTNRLYFYSDFVGTVGVYGKTKQIGKLVTAVSSETVFPNIISNVSSKNVVYCSKNGTTLQLNENAVAEVYTNDAVRRYNDIDTAIAAASNGGVIKLLADCEISVTTDVLKIALNGFTATTTCDSDKIVYSDTVSSETIQSSTLGTVWNTANLEVTPYAAFETICKLVRIKKAVQNESAYDETLDMNNDNNVDEDDLAAFRRYLLDFDANDPFASL